MTLEPTNHSPNSTTHFVCQKHTEECCGCNPKPDCNFQEEKWLEVFNKEFPYIWALDDAEDARMQSVLKDIIFRIRAEAIAETIEKMGARPERDVKRL